VEVLLPTLTSPHPEFTRTTGRKVDETEWHKCTAFSRTAEICGEYLHKGSLIYVEGRLQTREWEDKDGNKRWTTSIIVENMRMLGSKGEGAGASPKATTTPLTKVLLISPMTMFPFLTANSKHYRV